MAAAPIPLFSERHVTPKTLVGPSPTAGARCALFPASSAAWRGRRRPATWIKGRMVSAICASVKLVDGARVLGAEIDEKPIIVIDNYDSFTYNLCQYIGELGTKFEVHRNDELTVDEIRRMKPRGIVISPGPGVPKESGISLQTVLELGPTIPIFGVCMGLQCIGEAFGGNVVRSPYGVVHGKSALIYYKEKLKDALFSGLPNPFTAARYHSLVIDKDSFPDDILEITAWTGDGLIMAARHKKYKHIQVWSLVKKLQLQVWICFRSEIFTSSFIWLVNRIYAIYEKKYTCRPHYSGINA
ncbi:Anthranilate synthase component II [Platanthera zijinensis]|uniref:anthranilate synthase n=1 Tax=Platanthera zijinensis TaxID=2320716 RepID=A0AAP0AZT1_9ASPA